MGNRRAAARAWRLRPPPRPGAAWTTLTKNLVVLAIASGGLACADGGPPPDGRQILREAKAAAEELDHVRYRFSYSAPGVEAEDVLTGRVTLRPLGVSDRYQARVEIVDPEVDPDEPVLTVVHDGSTISRWVRASGVVERSPLWVAGPQLLADVSAGVMYTFFDPGSMAGDVAAESVVWEGRSEVGGEPCDLVRVGYVDDDEDSLWCFGRVDRLPRSLSWVDGSDHDQFVLTDLETDFALADEMFELTPPETEVRFVEHGVPSGLEAPDWRLATTEGSWVDLATLRGTVVVLEFWASWCVPCWQSLEGLQRLHEELDADDAPVRVFGVNTMETEDPRAFAESRGLTFPVLVDGDDVHAAYVKGSIPAFTVIDRDGRVVGNGVGYFGSDSEAYLRELIDMALERPVVESD